MTHEKGLQVIDNIVIWISEKDLEIYIWNSSAFLGR